MALPVQGSIHAGPVGGLPRRLTNDVTIARSAVVNPRRRIGKGEIRIALTPGSFPAGTDRNGGTRSGGADFCAGASLGRRGPPSAVRAVSPLARPLYRLGHYCCPSFGPGASCRIAGSAVKAGVGHGDWLLWLQTEFGWSEPTARRYMQVAGAFQNAHSERFDTLTIDATALYALSAADVAQEARDIAIERAEAGEHITKAEACEIRLRAERRCGQLLRDREMARGGHKAPTCPTNVGGQVESQRKLSELGLSHTQSSRFQKLAISCRPSRRKGSDRMV